jgi:hypothetical protein
MLSTSTALEGMLPVRHQMPPDVIMHACMHNPTTLQLMVDEASELPVQCTPASGFLRGEQNCHYRPFDGGSSCTHETYTQCCTLDLF